MPPSLVLALLALLIAAPAHAGRNFCISASVSPGASGAGTCEDGATNSTYSPWDLETLQAWIATPANVLPGDNYYFDGDFEVAVDRPFLNLTAIHGDPETDPDCPYVCCNCVSFVGGSFSYYNEASLTDGIVYRGSSYVALYNSYIDHAYHRSNANGISIYHADDACSDGLAFSNIDIDGDWLNSFYVGPGDTTLGCGVTNFKMQSSRLFGSRNAAVVLDTYAPGVIWSEAQLATDNFYEHSDVLFLFTTFRTTGDFEGATIASGACGIFNSVLRLELSGNDFFDCAINAVMPGYALDHVSLFRCASPEISNNAFHFNLPYAVGSQAGDNAIRIDGDCSGGTIRYNIMQGIAGSAVFFNTPVGDGLVTSDGTRRYNHDWTIAWNVFEDVGETHYRAAIWIDTRTCTVNCLDDARIIHNTIFMPKPVYEVLLVDGEPNTLAGLDVVNNAFYLQDGSVGTTKFISLSVPQPLRIIGNAFVQTDGFAAPYLFVTSESRSYSSLVELRVDGYEQWQGNATGFEATVPVALTVRLRNLPPSTSTADPATGNVTGDATLPTADGDYINGLGLCVDSSGAPLDVLFRCPGHERFVTSSLDQLPQGLLEAYQLFDNSPAIGVGVLPELLYSDDALQSLGHLDIMLRDRVTSDRPLQADPGAYRFIPSLEIMARGKLVLYGNYWVYSGDIPAGATLSVSAGSNATFGDAPSLGANSTVVVENDGILNFLSGTSVLEGGSRFLVQPGGSLMANSRIQVGGGATFGVDNGAVQVQGLELSPGSALDFGPGKPIAVQRSVRLGGLFTLRLAQTTGERGDLTAPMTLTVPVATFPAGGASGQFQSMTAVGSGANACDDIVVTPDTSSPSSLSVVVQLTPRPNCQGVILPGVATSAPSSPLSPGAIAGIVVGGVVALALLFALVLLVRRRAHSQLVAARVAEKHRSEVIDSERRRSAQLSAAGAQDKRRSVELNATAPDQGLPPPSSAAVSAASAVVVPSPAATPAPAAAAVAAESAPRDDYTVSVEDGVLLIDL